MRVLTTILLALLAAFLVTCAVFLTVDGNLARITGWYRFEPGKPLFTEANAERIQNVNWMRIADLHDRIECEKDRDGSWWITFPFRDRMSQQAVDAILSFTANAKLVDTLPLNKTVKGSMREFGVETSPHTITLKVPSGDNEHTTIARYTLGSTAPWLADAGDGKNLIRTTYLRTDFYSRDKRIHVVTGNMLEVFRNGLFALRDPYVLCIQPEKVRSISIQQPGNSGVEPLHIQRLSAEAPWIIQSPIITPANQEALRDFVSKLCRLKAIQVEDQSAVSLPGQPECVILLQQEGEDKPHEVKLYPTFAASADEQTLCYATVDDRPVVFTLEAEPRVRRRGCYARLINTACQLPVLPTDIRAKLLSNSGAVYTGELPLSLDALRSKQFTDVRSDDIYRVMLASKYDSFPLALTHIPGDKDSGVQDTWLYSADGKPFAEAEQDLVKSFVRSLSEVPVESIVEDIPLGTDRREAMRRYGLNAPYYTLAVLPNPCRLRATLFGVNLPLLKDRSARTFYISRYRDGETGQSMWVGMEKDGNTIYRLSSKLTRMFSLQWLRWKNRSLFHFPISALRKLTLGFQQQPLELEYDYIGEAWTGKLGQEDVTPRINPHRAVYYVRQLQKMQVEQWVDPADIDALKALAHPVFSVKLELELTDYSDAEAVVIEQTDDMDIRQHGDSLVPVLAGDPGKTRTELAEEMLTEDSATDAALRRLAMAERPTIKKTLTLEIAISADPSEEPFFYGRVRETGEVFILSYQTAQSLAASILDM